MKATYTRKLRQLIQCFDSAFALATQILKTDPENPYAETCKKIERRLELRKLETDEKNGLSKRLTKDRVWMTHIKAILTNQQNSSLDGNIGKVAKNFKYRQCLEDTENLNEKAKIKYFEDKLTTMRFHSDRAIAFTRNLEFFNGCWKELHRKLRELKEEAFRRPPPDRETLLLREREVADYLKKHLDQVSLKTSRNILQMLGLSHYVMPIDIRVTEEASKFGIAVGGRLSKKAYLQVEEELIELAEGGEILPRQLDGYLFFCKELKGALRKIKEMKLTVAQHKQLDRIWKFLESLNID